MQHMPYSSRGSKLLIYNQKKKISILHSRSYSSYLLYCEQESGHDDQSVFCPPKTVKKRNMVVDQKNKRLNNAKYKYIPLSLSMRLQFKIDHRSGLRKQKISMISMDESYLKNLLRIQCKWFASSYILIYKVYKQQKIKH